MKKGIISAIILATLFTGFYLYTPYSVLSDIGETIEAGDQNRLAEYIELESVRESLKKDLNDHIQRGIVGSSDESNTEPSLGGLLGGMIGSFFSESLGELVIDFFVSPESMMMLLSGEIPDYDGQESTQNQVSKSALESAVWRYDSLNRFLVIMNDGQEDQITLTLTRRGMSWVITEIDLFN